MSRLTLQTANCVSFIVICGCALCTQRVQLQEELVLVLVSRDGDSNFGRWFVASATTVPDIPHPLKFVFWKLLDPISGITTSDRVASDRAD